MNALVGVKPIDNALLAWLVANAGSSCRVSDVARRFDWSEPYASLRVKSLRLAGLVEPGRGCCEPTALAVARVRAFQALQEPVPETARSRTPSALPEADHATAAPDRAVEVAPLSGTGRLVTEGGLRAMEPRGSIEPPIDALVDALASFQDHALAQANAQLRLEVTELRAERDELRRRCERLLLVLAQAADIITG